MGHTQAWFAAVWPILTPAEHEALDRAYNRGLGKWPQGGIEAARQWFAEWFGRGSA